MLHHKQSIYNKQLIYSKRIKEENIRSSASQLSDYRTKLDADIRTAYFEYLQAVTLKEAIMRSVANAQQNLSSIQRLLDQQNLTKESLYKSKSNLSNVQAQLTDIENTRLKNKYYFNFLLNRAQQDTILTDKFYLFDPLKEYKISHEPDTIETDYRLGGLKSAVKSAGLQRSLIHSQNLPVFQFKGTGGLAAPDWIFVNRLPYAALELSFKWNIFNSGASHARSRQAYFQQQSFQADYDNTKNQIEVDQRLAYHDVTSQIAVYHSTNDAFEYADVYYRAVQTKFLAGLATLLELLDAEYSLQQADINRLKWYYTLQIRISTYQKQTGKTIKLN